MSSEEPRRQIAGTRSVSGASDKVAQGSSSSPTVPTVPINLGSFVYPIRSLLSGIQPVAELSTAAPPSKDDIRIGPTSGSGGQASSSSTSSDTKRKNTSTGIPHAAGGSSPLSSSGSQAASLSRGYAVDEDAWKSLTDSDPSNDSAGDDKRIAPSASRSIVVTRKTPSTTSSSSQSEQFNISDRGFVHLPPLPDSRSTSGGSSSHGSSNASQQPANQYSTRVSDASSSGSLEVTSSSQSGSRSSSAPPLATLRYEHAQDKDGHHVILGREGQLNKCEDEPIHAPGAVQGFGVLLVLEEDEEKGDLVVRQVSENSSEILGLSPRYLFSLECFTQTLPDSQADLLWDNVQFLQDSESDGEFEADFSPQVFLLSGWGEPGSLLTEDGEPGSSNDRRFWTCWCAAHCPITRSSSSPAASGSSSTNNLKGGFSHSNQIILEFELERDPFNPLYPQFPSSAAETSRSSGGSSPFSGSSAGNSVSMGSASPSSGGTRTSRDADGSGSTTATSAGSSSLFESSTGNATATQEHADRVVHVGPIRGANTPAGNTAINVAGMGDAFDANELFLTSMQGLEGDDTWFPRPEDIWESTTSFSKPLKALEKMRRVNRDPTARSGRTSASSSVSGMSAPSDSRRRRQPGGGSQAGVGTMDIFAVLAQVNDQLSAAPDLQAFLKVVVGVMKDLTQFHRVLVYQFDEQWNGQCVSELLDWKQSHDLYKGLHFPASDIPAQARELYKINKVRSLYDRSQTTARLVVRSRRDLEKPLDMTHCYIRAMSPIHLKYLGNMGVRSSMSVSIIAFGALWGLIACHSYGLHGMRVSFPVRQMLRLLSDSISRNVERLSYAKRLHTHKLINTLPTDSHPTGYIVSNAEDLLGLFDADFGVLVIGEGAKIFGPNQRGQEILLFAEYLRLKQFQIMQVSQSVAVDFPDLLLPSGPDTISGLLYVPLSRGGKDFICFLRKGLLRDVHWAGKPYKEEIHGQRASLEPRKSFKMWSERVSGRCRAWTDEQMETAGVLSLVYGKFIEVWRQKESAMQATQLTTLLLSNASHEVRTPLNHIINYLEMALNGPLDNETRENLNLSHMASKSLLFTINDLLDLTKFESGQETSFNEPFNLHAAIDEAINLYKNEALRRDLAFEIDLVDSPKWVVGDMKKIRTVVSNLTGNAVKYTKEGGIKVTCQIFKEPQGLRNDKQIAVEIIVADSGMGIDSTRLESIFREFERVESSNSSASEAIPGLGLGLAIVARIVEQLGGQLRVDSKPGVGSRFSFLTPLGLPGSTANHSLSPHSSVGSSVVARSLTNSSDSHKSEIDSLVEAISSSYMGETSAGQVSVRKSGRSKNKGKGKMPAHPPTGGRFEVTDSNFPIRSVKMGDIQFDDAEASPPPSTRFSPVSEARSDLVSPSPYHLPLPEPTKLRVLIVEDDPINRTILSKRLTLDGHTVLYSTNGQECVELIAVDADFDCILMDIQMPLLNGFDATRRIRDMENEGTERQDRRLSKFLNGRIPIFAVSASLREKQREDMMNLGMDGYILKPVDFNRLRDILQGILDPQKREMEIYKSGTSSWEMGGWFAQSRTQLW